MNSLNCAVFLIFLIPIIIAVRSQRAAVSYPLNIQIMLASENSAKVTWTPTPNFYETKDKYILYVNDTSGPRDPIPFNIPRGITEYEIGGLLKNDEYSFWMVTTRNENETQITKPIHYIHVVTGDNISTKVVNFDDTVRGNLKGNVSLKCSIVGKPTPSIIWFKDDKHLAENPRMHILNDGSLFINELRKEDEGKYKCRANNTDGEGEVIYELVFQGNTTFDKCQFEKNAHVRAVMDGQEINDESIEVPDQSVLKLRCNNSDEFFFEGDNILRCDKTKWNGTIPTCTRLSLRKRHSIPMIKYKITNGNYSVDDDGSLSVTEGATLKLRCLYFQSYTTNIKWISTNKTQIIDAVWNSRQNAYKLIFSPISHIHESKYSCCINQNLCNSIRIRATERPCKMALFGCCPNGRTISQGPNYRGCGCQGSQYGCCLDGITPAKGPSYEGCKWVIPNKPGEVCGLPKERGKCGNFTVKWFFDIEYGICSRFWYGGCEGNDNRFETREECEQVCVTPEAIDACHLPSVAGPCEDRKMYWYYNFTRQQCEQFSYNGCLGNNNRFRSEEECEQTCSKAEKNS